MTLVEYEKVVDALKATFANGDKGDAVHKATEFLFASCPEVSGRRLIDCSYDEVMAVIGKAKKPPRAKPAPQSES